jgi:hypothetical protein
MGHRLALGKVDQDRLTPLSPAGIAPGLRAGAVLARGQLGSLAVGCDLRQGVDACAAGALPLGGVGVDEMKRSAPSRRAVS